MGNSKDTSIKVDIAGAKPDAAKQLNQLLSAYSKLAKGGAGDNGGGSGGGGGDVHLAQYNYYTVNGQVSSGPTSLAEDLTRATTAAQTFGTVLQQLAEVAGDAVNTTRQVSRWREEQKSLAEGSLEHYNPSTGAAKSLEKAAILKNTLDMLSGGERPPANQALR